MTDRLRRCVEPAVRVGADVRAGHDVGLTTVLSGPSSVPLLREDAWQPR